jgi:hypothetical protein
MSNTMDVIINDDDNNVLITVPPPKKAKITKVVVDENINKAPNFHLDEDHLLAIAWVSASDNSLVGCEQKAAVFCPHPLLPITDKICFT